MPLMCIQCAMRAMLNDETPPMFEETMDEHIRRVHPNPVETAAERIELERLLAEQWRKMN